LESNGSRLAAVLDGLRDRGPERFEAINSELGRWLPEFDRILFDPIDGAKAIALRTRDGHYRIPASGLSQGTLIALALLTLAHLPEPPSILGLEEPDRGIHPRLLRRVKDALYRLSHPESYGEDRDPVQVIATTHSPYFLDLFKDHPEEIVICEKLDHEVRFQRLSDLPNIDEILQGAPLGEAWYTGILGGVPSEP
jgi:predicted ATPase